MKISNVEEELNVIINWIYLRNVRLRQFLKIDISYYINRFKKN